MLRVITQTMAKHYYTVSEAAEYLGISTNAVRKAINAKPTPRLVATPGKYVVERTIKRTLTGPLITKKDLDNYRVSERHRYAGKKTD